ncbi:MAG: cyclic nucleotide-binding domain-containing protein, partial [Devosia sp.]
TIMPSLLSLAASHPERKLEPGEALVTQNDEGGDLFILESGKLVVERDGVAVATLAQANILVGEMSVLLGIPNSATVRADGYARVRVIEDARAILLKDPEMTFQLAAMVASRLNATTALLVDLSNENTDKAEKGLLGRILAAIHLPSNDAPPDGEQPTPWGLVTPSAGL